MGLQNLRNKYRNHPVIKPIIEHCERHDLGFEFVKETRQIGIGFKGFKYVNTYYMQIGDSLINPESELWHWNDLFRLIVRAYKHLELEYPDNLVKAAKTFNRQI